MGPRKLPHGATVNCVYFLQFSGWERCKFDVLYTEIGLNYNDIWHETMPRTEVAKTFEISPPPAVQLRPTKRKTVDRKADGEGITEELPLTDTSQ